ncbi:unnamed protein product [Tuber aestivum]|uniref:Uncharacterized protein n=1 Tax=Tuber aestivum TaxID=59557 RepID=A0A292Q739_9PEZI|nr:unnamed protein product [Tuber aestivum]
MTPAEHPISYEAIPENGVQNTDQTERLKPGPRPGARNQIPATFRASVKRVIKTRSREEKLAVLQYWKHGRVQDENRGEAFQRPVTLKEVSVRYKRAQSRTGEEMRRQFFIPDHTVVLGSRLESTYANIQKWNEHSTIASANAGLKAL